MAHEDHHHGLSSYNLEEHEIEMEIEDEQEAAAAAGSSSFAECALGFVDKPKCQGTLSQQGDKNLEVNLNYIGDDITMSQGSHQSPRQQQLEARDTLVTSVPQRRSTRPRTRRGFTLWQLNSLEKVFKRAPYPDVITKKSLARHLYLGEFEVQRWFKNRRAKHRKYQRLQMLKRAPESTQNTFH